MPQGTMYTENFIRNNSLVNFFFSLQNDMPILCKPLHAVHGSSAVFEVKVVLSIVRKRYILNEQNLLGV